MSLTMLALLRLLANFGEETLSQQAVGILQHATFPLSAVNGNMDYMALERWTSVMFKATQTV